MTDQTLAANSASVSDPLVASAAPESQAVASGTLDSQAASLVLLEENILSFIEAGGGNLGGTLGLVLKSTLLFVNETDATRAVALLRERHAEIHPTWLRRRYRQLTRKRSALKLAKLKSKGTGIFV